MHILAIILDSLQSNSPITSPPSGYRKKKRNIGQHSSLSSMLNVVFLVIRHCLSGIMSIKLKGILKVYFNCHNLNGIKLITRLRLSLSDLHDHKFKSSRLHQRNWYRILVIIFSMLKNYKCVHIRRNFIMQTVKNPSGLSKTWNYTINPRSCIIAKSISFSHPPLESMK